MRSGRRVIPLPPASWSPSSTTRWSWSRNSCRARRSNASTTGIVDWDGAARDDHRFDLITLRFGIHSQQSEPGVAERLNAVLDTFPEDVLRPAWAHMSLRMTDWAIRHFTPADVEHWLDLAEQRVR